MMRGLVNRLLKHSFVDGPGNRAVIFMQGCSLRCLYCHNPQTQATCDGCGVCIPGCKGEALTFVAPGMPLAWDPDRCMGCDQCINVCPTHADPRSTWYTVEQLVDWLRPNAPFLSGVTVSGGEPLLQPEFIAAFFREVKGLGLTTMIETAAHVEYSAFEAVLPWLDGALVDLKVWEDEGHRALTGSTNVQIKENIRRLAAAGKVAEVRIPIIPGFSDTPENLIATASFVAELDPNIPLRLQRFRAHGTRGIARTWESPAEELMDRFVLLAKEVGLAEVTRSR